MWILNLTPQQAANGFNVYWVHLLFVRASCFIIHNLLAQKNCVIENPLSIEALYECVCKWVKAVNTVNIYHLPYSDVDQCVGTRPQAWYPHTDLHLIYIWSTFIMKPHPGSGSGSIYFSFNRGKQEVQFRLGWFSLQLLSHPYFRFTQIQFSVSWF